MVQKGGRLVVGCGVVLVFDGMGGRCDAEDAVRGGDFLAGDCGGGMGARMGATSVVMHAMHSIDNLRGTLHLMVTEMHSTVLSSP